MRIMESEVKRIRLTINDIEKIFKKIEGLTSTTAYDRMMDAILEDLNTHYPPERNMEIEVNLGGME